MADSPLHLDILDSARQAAMPLFGAFKSRFYLAGGTALALQLGHRDSIDFDFFTEESFDPEALHQELLPVFAGHEVTITQAAPGTLSLLLDSSIRLSFLSYPYPLVAVTVDTPDLRLASIIDIGAMKLSAIVSRSTLKDYVDLYVILQYFKLSELLEAAQQKFPSLDVNVILKALVYFEDIEDEPITFEVGKEVSQPVLKDFLRAAVREL